MQGTLAVSGTLIKLSGSHTHMTVGEGLAGKKKGFTGSGGGGDNGDFGVK